jgi:hypothetical protein
MHIKAVKTMFSSNKIILDTLYYSISDSNIVNKGIIADIDKSKYFSDKYKVEIYEELDDDNNAVKCQTIEALEKSIKGKFIAFECDSDVVSCTQVFYKTHLRNVERRLNFVGTFEPDLYERSIFLTKLLKEIINAISDDVRYKAENIENMLNLGYDLFLLSELHIVTSESDFICQIGSKENRIKKAIEYFGLIYKEDFDVSEEGNVIVYLSPIQKAHRKIETGIIQFGSVEFLKQLFESLKSTHDDKYDRYLFNRGKKSMGIVCGEDNDINKIRAVDAPIPVNYFIQIAVKHLCDCCSNEETNQKLYNEIIEDGRNLVDLLQIFEGDIIKDTTLQLDAFSEYFCDNINLEIMCFPLQYSKQFTIDLLNDLYIPFAFDNCTIENLTKEDVVKIAKTIFDFPICRIFTAKELSNDSDLEITKVIKFLDLFSIYHTEINYEFFEPFNKVNSTEYPVIKLSKDRYIFIEPHFFGFNFCNRSYINCLPDTNVVGRGNIIKTINGNFGGRFKPTLKKNLNKKITHLNLGT